MIKFHLPYHSINILSCCSVIANERTNLGLDPKLTLLFGIYKVYLIYIYHLPDVLQGKYPHGEEIWYLVRGQLTPINSELYVVML